MCYPCSHCGACKVKLDPDVCPNCHAPIEVGKTVCDTCGFPLPLPPGQAGGATQAKDAKVMDGQGNEEAAGEIETAENASQGSKKRWGDELYIPPNMDDGQGAPRAEEYGVIGSWPVPTVRPKL